MCRPRRRADTPDRIDWAAGPADAAVASNAPAYRTDEEAVRLLTRPAEWKGTAVLVDASRPDGLSPHAAEAALHAFTATGSPLRDSAPPRLFSRSGSGRRVERTVALGGGAEATVLRRA